MSLLLGKTLGPDAAATMAELAAPDEEEGGMGRIRGPLTAVSARGLDPRWQVTPPRLR
jgi:hypothetical protein